MDGVYYTQMQIGRIKEMFDLSYILKALALRIGTLVTADSFHFFTETTPCGYGEPNQHSIPRAL